MSTSSAAQYAFLPWLRQGMAKHLGEAHIDSLGQTSGGSERVSLSVELAYQGQSLSKTLQLIGPGDITGLNPEAIVCAEPQALIRNFEPNYLPYLEFYEVDLPWRYTPARATNTDQLRPWLALIVLKEDSDEYEVHYGEGDKPYLKLNADKLEDIFHPHAQHWAWAHVHVHQALDESDAIDDLQSLIEQTPDAAVSRLLCPRKLEAYTRYLGVLVPAFEAGRLAGLGVSTAGIPAQQGSWDITHTERAHEYPIYYQWSFGTGSEGDFEALVQKLLPPIVPDPGLGERDLNINDAGYGLDDLADTQTLGLQGALRPTGFSPDAWPQSGNSGDQAYQDQLRLLLNLSADFQQGNVDNTTENPHNQAALTDDPIITPPIYGQWHAGVRRLEASGQADWLAELNLDPRQRAVAGLGAAVVRQHQEYFMEVAWAQVEAVNEANDQIRQATLAERVNRSLYRKHIVRRDDHSMLVLSQSMQDKVMDSASAQPIAERIRKSELPQALQSASFRKLSRPGRRVVKRLHAQSSQRIDADLSAHYVQNDSLKIAVNPKPEMSAGLSLSNLSAAVSNLTKSGGALANQSDPNLGLMVNKYSSDLSIFSSALDDLAQAQTAESIMASEVASLAQDMKQALQPKAALTRRMGERIQRWSEQNQSFEPLDKLAPIMAYPAFPVPTYEYLTERSAEYLIPNLHLLPANCVTLLEPNQAFVEAYLAGMNHEMARELLWREYPTDQRGSYFRQFWDVTDSVETLPEDGVPDIEAMDDWTGKLGTHPANSQVGLVLLIRGELLQKFPDTLIYAQRAEFAEDDPDRVNDRILSSDEPVENLEFPLFKAQLNPDIVLLGFSFSATVAKGNRAGDDPGWYFVIRERPGRLRFGLEVSTDAEDPSEGLAEWDELSWGHLAPDGDAFQAMTQLSLEEPRSQLLNSSVQDAAGLNWGHDAGQQAAILLQVPVAVAIHADKMID